MTSRACIPRTNRLLKSLDELEREIRDSKFSSDFKDIRTCLLLLLIEEAHIYHIVPNRTYTQRQADLARNANVIESAATKEFLKERKDWFRWTMYKDLCLIRHVWGVYLRSSLDWDWDTASCLERLFKLPDEVVPQTALIASIDLDAVEADTWIISTNASLPKQMRVAYRSASGKMEYMTFLHSPSVGDVVSADESTHVTKVRDEASAIITEPRAGGREEDENGLGIMLDENSDSTPELETDTNSGVKQVIEKQEEVALITEEPSYGAVEKSREESEIVVQENGVAPQAHATELGVKDNRFGDGCADEYGLEEMMKNLEVIKEQQADQISILSLD